MVPLRWLATTIPELASLTFQSQDGPGRAKGLTSLRYPIDLKSYNMTIVRKADDIDATFRGIPELAESFLLLESYSTQGVQAVDPKSTVFPHRTDELPINSYVQYNSNLTIDPVGQNFGERLPPWTVPTYDTKHRNQFSVHSASQYEVTGTQSRRYIQS